MNGMIMSGIVPETSAAARTNEADVLVSLIGSRICHDLVSPVGAISNGVELLGMGGAAPDGPEMQLVADSVAHASARLRFFRIAFGVAGEGQMLGRSETELVLADCYGGGRLALTWGVTEDQPRQSVKLAFLLLQCVETALPRGGTVHISQTGGRWRIEARSEHLSIDSDLWALLDGRAVPTSLRPADVQFALAPRSASQSGRHIDVETRTNQVTLTF